MEQGTTQQVNLSSYRRLSGTAIWYPDGSVAGKHFGRIDMQGLDEGISRESVMQSFDGRTTLAFEDAISAKPVWTLKGKQFHTAIRAILAMGTYAGTVVQTSATGSTATITAELGGTFQIGTAGARNLNVTDVSVGGVSKISLLDVAFFLEQNKGLIRFPEVAAGIADGASVLVTFNKPALTREKYTMFDKLNQKGELLLFGMDDKSSVPFEELLIPGTISRDKGTDGDPTKSDQWGMRFSLNGTATAIMRAA